MRSPLKKKSKKHPTEMTDEEALKHLFHPKIVKAVKTHLKGQTESVAKRKKE
jgi:hypothetical protein